MTARNLVGMKFGRLTVEGLDRSSERVRCVCRCDCGAETRVLTFNLTSGRTKSCGCLERQGRSGGASKSSLPEYRVWYGMILRCYDPDADSYRWYGGRGVKVCERWREFTNFLADMPPRPSMQHTLDRIDSDGDYEPGNCRWATWEEQAKNRRSNIVKTVRGVTGCVSDLCKHFGLNRQRVYYRLRCGKSLEEAFS